MRIVLVVAAVLGMLLVSSLDKSSAEPSEEKISIIKNCERIYPDLEKIGKEKFEQRYMYEKNLRTCLQLYNNFAWDSKDPDRMENLAAAIEELSVSKEIRDRPSQSQTIPQWIKQDATRWYKGEGKDTLLTFGIRHLIESKMIEVPQTVPKPSSCQDELCLLQGDFITYSISESDSTDATILKHTIQNTDSSVLITSSKITKDERTTEHLQVSKSGLVMNNNQCCSYYQFAHKIPIEIGSDVNSAKALTVTHELRFPFKDSYRTAFLAKDKTGYYQEVIDKETGIVLFAKHQDNIRKTTKTIELTGTNAFSRGAQINYSDAHVPVWLRDTVKWWTFGIITDSEYLDSLSYLLKNNVLRL